jgi:outer membrane immunogenic protein
MFYRTLFFGASAVALTIAAPAAAQDYDWTGFYVGANAGISWGDTSLDFDVEPGSGSVVIPPPDVTGINQIASDDGNKSGFTGGVQAGYNWQFGSWLFGIETDYGFMDIDQHRTNAYQSTVAPSPPVVPPPPLPTYAIEQRVQSNWIWTVRPRLGYVSGPMMFYVTGGLAMTEIDLTTSIADNRIPPNSASVDEEEGKTGWTLGLGGAYAFSPNWSLRGEWLYADFGNVDISAAAPNGFYSLESEGKVKANLIRVGVDYKF